LWLQWRPEQRREQRPIGDSITLARIVTTEHGGMRVELVLDPRVLLGQGRFDRVTIQRL